MNKLGVILLASDQDQIIFHTVSYLKRLTQYIMVLVDKPTKIVCQAIKDCPIIYDWKKTSKEFSMTEMLETLDTFIKKQELKCEWILRSDGDEIWNDGVLKEILFAERNNFNIINFKLRNHHPILAKWGNNQDIFKFTRSSSNHFFKSNILTQYQRAWKTNLIDKNFRFIDGGHQVFSTSANIFNSNFHFDHFYALDFKELSRKALRNFSQRDIQNKFNHHYSKLIMKP